MFGSRTVTFSDAGIAVDAETQNSFIKWQPYFFPFETKNYIAIKTTSRSLIYISKKTVTMEERQILEALCRKHIQKEIIYIDKIDKIDKMK